jgi:hypothetical protein
MRTLRMVPTAIVYTLGSAPVWAVTGFVVLITFGCLILPQASADVRPIPDPGITEQTIIVIPNHATYQVEGDFILGEDRLREARAPFGSGGFCPLQATINSFWPTDSTITLRKFFSLPAGATNLRVLLSIDNDATVLINGEEIGQVVHEGCPLVDEFLLRADDDILKKGGNRLEVRATDRGVESYIDLRVLVDVP